MLLPSLCSHCLEPRARLLVTTAISNPTPQKKAHSFAVSSGSHALRTYTDDAGVPLAAAGRTLRGHAARTACVCRCLWGHLKMRGFLSIEVPIHLVIRCGNTMRDASAEATICS